MSKIEWTEVTWNPVTGCDRVSPGCDHCYALTMARRKQAMGDPAYRADGDPITSGPGFAVTCHPDRLHLPYEWRKPRLVFVNSMSDLFHDRVPVEFIEAVFETMAETPRHTFQVLTKRSRRLLRLAPRLPWPPNVWMGVSVEDQARAYRAERLAEVPAAVRFLSVEPMLGPVRPGAATMAAMDWVIAGGESGPGARPMELDWVRDLAGQCEDFDVPLFVKQLGQVWAGGRGKGGDMSLWPPELRIRQMPSPQAREAVR